MKELLVFFGCESGAVTVDWVVLTAAVIGVGLVVLTPIGNAINSAGGRTAADIVSQPIGFVR